MKKSLGFLTVEKNESLNLTATGGGAYSLCTMTDIAESYCLLHDLSVDYARALRRVARSLEEAGVDPSTIDSVRFNRWLGSISRSPITRSNYCRMGMTLWKFAAKKRLASESSGEIKKVKAPLPPVIAWSQPELLQLLAFAEKTSLNFRGSGCPQRIFWRAWILGGYETGVRFGDLFSLRVAQLKGSRLNLIQHKTGQPIGKILSQPAAHAMAELAAAGDGQTIFRWAISRKHIFLNSKRLVAEAGLCGSTKWLRRSGATAVERTHPGSASKFLGHLSPTVCRHYLDMSLLAEVQPRPPALLGSAE